MIELLSSTRSKDTLNNLPLLCSCTVAESRALMAIKCGLWRTATSTVNLKFLCLAVKRYGRAVK